VAPERLTFELTETVAVADIEQARAFLGALGALGCRSALDDFGSGFASFAYLKDLPVQTVKIDGRFVRNVLESPTDQAILRAMNEIAHALGKTTVAEFVEDEPTLRLLRALGIDEAQGYHIGRPQRLTEPAPHGH
ncbi:MAG TPA: EAL domain-containing protein, partial [Acidiferrobacteraceae bacterium]|nr:EAL domain-containing protein [Acidiferrobacteraceae bacterium]